MAPPPKTFRIQVQAFIFGSKLTWASWSSAALRCSGFGSIVARNSSVSFVPPFLLLLLDSMFRRSFCCTSSFGGHLVPTVHPLFLPLYRPWFMLAEPVAPMCGPNCKSLFPEEKRGKDSTHAHTHRRNSRDERSLEEEETAPVCVD